MKKLEIFLTENFKGVAKEHSRKHHSYEEHFIFTANVDVALADLVTSYLKKWKKCEVVSKPHDHADGEMSMVGKAGTSFYLVRLITLAAANTFEICMEELKY